MNSHTARAQVRKDVRGEATRARTNFQNIECTSSFKDLQGLFCKTGAKQWRQQRCSDEITGRSKS